MHETALNASSCLLQDFLESLRARLELVELIISERCVSGVNAFRHEGLCSMSFELLSIDLLDRLEILKFENIICFPDYPKAVLGTSQKIGIKPLNLMV